LAFSQKPLAAPALRAASSPKNVRMTADHLGRDGLDDLAEAEGAYLRGELARD